MDNIPLNKAHQLDRRGQALLKQKKFDESIECHENAIRSLHEALQSSENHSAKESIQLQIDCHRKQINSLNIKKSQYEDWRYFPESIYSDCIAGNREVLQHEISHTMEIHDSLIEVLLKRNKDDDNDRYMSDSEKSSSDICDEPKVLGKKRQVNDAVLLEEFKGLSEKLRESVHILMLLLDDKDKEIARLKAEIYKMECEKNKGDGVKANNTLKVITDSSGGTSPYVFSPCSELSPDVHELRALPSLAPLEMPNFDFASLMKNTKNLNLNSTSHSNN